MKQNNDACEIFCINEKIVKEVKSSMLSDEEFFKLSENFKIISDSTRIKILYALSKKELCVCDLATILKMKQSAISHQLRILKDTRLVKFRKEGKIVYYSLIDKHVIKLLDMGVEHAKE
ncbi:Putative arsenical resistance operon repressor ArsR [uncultured archaeon]|nr:Putative arsenical resistance operon repressor ArsR [uncultured archaeon]